MTAKVGGAKDVLIIAMDPLLLVSNFLVKEVVEEVCTNDCMDPMEQPTCYSRTHRVRRGQRKTGQIQSTM